MNENLNNAITVEDVYSIEIPMQAFVHRMNDVVRHISAISNNKESAKIGKNMKFLKRQARQVNKKQQCMINSFFGHIFKDMAGQTLNRFIALNEISYYMENLDSLIAKGDSILSGLDVQREAPLFQFVAELKELRNDVRKIDKWHRTVVIDSLYDIDSSKVEDDMM